jgi:hypothetical protein
MTYSESVADVIEELGVDGNRRGIELQRARWIRDGFVDLQRFIRAYREGHTTTYQVADLEEKGYAHLGTLPEQAKPKAFYIVSEVPDAETEELPNPNIARNRLDYVAWEDRLDRMIRRGSPASADGSAACFPRGSREYLYAISPFSRQFLVHPLVNDETYLLVVWDGLKMAFADNDVVPWPEWAAEAVASYVKWKILKFVDKRPDLAQGEYAAYVQSRRSLWREQNEAQVADGRDEEYTGSVVPNPAPFANFGAQGIPFLSTITQLEGSDNTALADVPTASISTVPYTVQILIDGALQTWVLRASSAANDPTNGLLRPNDFNATTNAKVWISNTL